MEAAGWSTELPLLDFAVRGEGGEGRGEGRGERGEGRGERGEGRRGGEEERRGVKVLMSVD